MKKKQKAEPESRRKSSYKGNSRNNSKSGGLTFSEKKRLIQLKHILSGKSNEKEKPTTAQKMCIRDRQKSGLIKQKENLF